MWEILIKKMMEQMMEQARKKADPQVIKTLEGKVLIDTNQNGVPDMFDFKIPIKEREAQIQSLKLNLESHHNHRLQGGQSDLDTFNTMHSVIKQKGDIEHEVIWDYVRIVLLILGLIGFGIYLVIT